MRGAVRLPGRHPATHVLLGLPFDVEGELFVELALLGREPNRDPMLAAIFLNMVVS